MDARIHTTRDGRAFDSIFISREFENDEDEIKRATRIGEVIEDALSGKTKLPEIIQRSGRLKEVSKVFSIKPKVTINNDLSNRFTVLEVEGLDRLGILSDITRTIADLKLNIGSAHIVTFGEKVIDSFYVTDLKNEKITSIGKQNKIIEALTKAMESASPQFQTAKISA